MQSKMDIPALLALGFVKLEGDDYELIKKIGRKKVKFLVMREDEAPTGWLMSFDMDCMEHPITVADVKRFIDEEMTEHRAGTGMRIAKKLGLTF